MDSKEIDMVIKQAKLFLQIHRPPREQTADEIVTAARARIAGFKDFWEEDQAIFAPDLPTHLYINKDGIPTVKGYYSHK